MSMSACIAWSSRGELTVPEYSFWSASAARAPTAWASSSSRRSSARTPSRRCAELGELARRAPRARARRTSSSARSGSDTRRCRSRSRARSCSWTTRSRSSSSALTSSARPGAGRRGVGAWPVRIRIAPRARPADRPPAARRSGVVGVVGAGAPRRRRFGELARVRSGRTRRSSAPPGHCALVGRGELRSTGQVLVRRLHERGPDLRRVGSRP